MIDLKEYSKQEFRDANVLIIGGISGVSFLAAETFMKEGARHALIIDKDRTSTGPHSILPHFRNINDVSEIPPTINAVVREIGGINIAINDTGIKISGDILALEPEEIYQMVMANNYGSILAVRAVLPHLIATKGQLINICPETHPDSFSSNDIFHVTRAVNTALTYSLHTRYRHSGVVTKGISLSPLLLRGGLFDTNVQGTLEESSRILTSQEVVATILKLCSSNNNNLAGTIYPIT